jgi:hypothetical protein
MLPGGEHKFTIVCKSIGAVLKEPGILVEDESEGNYVKPPPKKQKLVRQQSIEYSATKTGRQKAKQAGATLIKERADQNCTNKKIRHSFEEKAFFFPLPCATITFPIETKSAGVLA